MINSFSSFLRLLDCNKVLRRRRRRRRCRYEEKKVASQKREEERKTRISAFEQKKIERKSEEKKTDKQSDLLPVKSLLAFFFLFLHLSLSPSLFQLLLSYPFAIYFSFSCRYTLARFFSCICVLSRCFQL